MKPLPSDPLNPAIALALLKDGLARDRRFKLRVASFSMAPLLKTGDHVFIKQFHPVGLKMGDMVVLHRDEDLFVHRLIAIDREGNFETKGDSLPFSDPPVEGRDILGYVVAIEQEGRSIDLSTPKWVRINRILGTLSRWEARWVQNSQRNPRHLSLKKSRLESGEHAADAIEREGPGETTKVNRLVRLPFRIMIRLVVFLST